MSPAEQRLAEGWKMHQAGDFAAAERCYREVLQEASDNENAWCFLGMVCHDLGRYEEALGAYRQALELKPAFPVALNNRGNTLRSLGRLDEAVASFQRALELQPDYPGAHYNQALALLLHGDLGRGWAEYEWRWRYLGLAEPTFPQPRWDGGPLNGRRILLHVEQGLGDTLQFVRYARVAQERGGQVVLIAQQALLPLLSRCDHVDEFVAQGGPLPAFDTHAPLMSMPRICGTTLDTIPASIPYIFPDPCLVEHWRRELLRVTACRVGVAWQGNPDNRSDRQRSFALTHLAPLAAIPGVQLISLQKGPGAEQVAQAAGRLTLADLGPHWDEGSGPFMDTAAILRNLDLVITADTALAHLAGAMGVPVWVLLPYAPDWRWLLGRDDSPWYPSMRLFRQQTPGDWEDVVTRVAEALKPWARVGQHRQFSYRDQHLAATRFNTLARARHGLMLFNRHDVYIGRSLERYGEFSEAEVEIFRQIVRPKDVVVEAGANIGTHTVPLAQLVGPQGRVLAFEPQRIIFQTLNANVALNSLSNVITRQAALGEQEGQIVVPPLDYEKENNFGGLGLGNFQTGETVPLLTLDSLQLPRLNFLKIDVEGMELSVLKGAARTIAQHHPILYVENDRADRSPPLIAWLQQLGYRLYWHLPPMFAPRNFYQNPANCFGRVVSVNMLGIHQSLAANIDGLRAVEGPESDWRR